MDLELQIKPSESGEDLFENDSPQTMIFPQQSDQTGQQSHLCSVVHIPTLFLHSRI